LSLISSTTRNVYSFPVNAPIQLKNAGWAVSVDCVLPKNFIAGGNVSFNTLLNSSAIPYGFLTGFNTPKYRYNLSVGNRNVQQTGIGFNVVWRHQDAFVWESSFANIEATNRRQTIIPAFGTLDAQINKRLNQYRTTLKLGGTNILGSLYTQSWGNPLIGSQYYVSLLID
jgi:iron complex outermembrane recepter protein